MFVKASMIRDLVARAQERVADVLSMLDRTFAGPQLDERAILIPAKEERFDTRFRG